MEISRRMNKRNFIFGGGFLWLAVAAIFSVLVVPDQSLKYVAAVLALLLMLFIIWALVYIAVSAFYAARYRAQQKIKQRESQMFLLKKMHRRINKGRKI